MPKPGDYQDAKVPDLYTVALLTLEALLIASAEMRLPTCKQSHQNHGGVEPCYGHEDTCCKVSFSQPCRLLARAGVNTTGRVVSDVRDNVMKGR